MKESDNPLHAAPVEPKVAEPLAQWHDSHYTNDWKRAKPASALRMLPGIVQGYLFEFHSKDDEHEYLVAATNQQEAEVLMEFLDPKQPYKMEEQWGRRIWMRR